jgi:hypothetical protein
MKVTLSSACSIEKEFMTVSPIDGDAYIDEEFIRTGLWTTNVVLANVKDCSEEGRVVEVGAECKIYSEPATGDGILVQKTIAYDGGGSSTPYQQIIYTFIGAE